MSIATHNDQNYSHDWPKTPESHLWGQWFADTKRTHYRECAHPGCTAYQTREAPKA